jgi:heme/copper-type cytochrome/quinol oxidase subunit 3
LYRLIDYHFTRQHHVGLELGILYWHMVDAIWLFLFICIYL